MRSHDTDWREGEVIRHRVGERVKSHDTEWERGCGHTIRSGSWREGEVTRHRVGGRVRG